MIRTLFVVLVLGLWVGCEGEVVTPGSDGGQPPPTTDAGANAMGDDAGSVVGDAGPCGACADPTPICDLSSGQCVGCLDADDCSPTTSYCVDSVCAECRTDDECSDPTAPVCEAGSCGGCAEDTECAGFADRPLCGPGGACVACLEDAACDDTDRCTMDACGADGLCSNAIDPMCIRDLSVGSAHACVVRAGGAVDCWGGNESGQLGDGTTVQRSTPVRVVGLTDAVAVATGHAHTCAVDRAGDVHCWGNAARGLGIATVASFYPTPQSLRQVDAVGVAAGRYHSCAVYADGTARCWGDGGLGQIGDGLMRDQQRPSLVHQMTTARQLEVGRSRSCARLASGRLQCWGFGLGGEIGDASFRTRIQPSTVAIVLDAIDVSMNFHTCAVERGGELWCWGNNESGKLGDGTTVNRWVPVRVAGVSATRVATGMRHTCAIRTGGQVACWGNNQHGVLGTPIAGDWTTAPAEVAGLADAIEIEAGDSSTCALRRNGEVWCWGHNGDGQLGDGTITSRAAPARVSGL